MENFIPQPNFDSMDMQKNAYLFNQFMKMAAEIRRASDQRPFQMQKVVINLTTARTESNPYILSVPMRSLFVRDASDSLANVNLSMNDSDAQAVANAISLKINDSVDFSSQVSKVALTWTAQSGKTMTLYLFTEAAFRSGSQLSLSAGGVSINDGTAFSNSVVTLTAATASLLFAADSTRKLGTWRNDTGADVWVGDSSVTNSGSTKGLRIAAGEIFQWRNTAAIYAYSVLGSSTEVTMGEY